MKYSILLLCILFAGCSSRQSVEDAKAVIKSHEEFVKAGIVDSVVGNMTDDVVGVFPGMPLIKGKDAFKIYYASIFKSGKTDLKHDIQGAEEEGDVVMLHGFAQGTLAISETTMMPLTENFLVLLKKQPDGRMKFWRLAFSPGAR